MRPLSGVFTAPLPVTGAEPIGDDNSEPIAKKWWAPPSPRAVWQSFRRGRRPRPRNVALDLINVPKAITGHCVTGQGVTIAVIDSGCRGDHSLFSDSETGSRIQTGIIFSESGNRVGTEDRTGHGTAVSSIIAAAGKPSIGIANNAKIIPLIVVGADEKTDFELIARALEWVRDHGLDKGVSIVNLSLGDYNNYSNVNQVDSGPNNIRTILADVIAELSAKKVPVVTAAGNMFAVNQPEVGMSFPAILPTCISVGAVYTKAQKSGREYSDYGNAKIYHPAEDLVTPFSQRLPKSSDNPHFTDLLAPGAPIKTLWHKGKDQEIGGLSGTSLAVPMVTGVIALMQEKHRNKFDMLPDCNQIKNWLRAGAVTVNDKVGKHDNVENTGRDYLRLNALGALNAMDAPILSG